MTGSARIADNYLPACIESVHSFLGGALSPSTPGTESSYSWRRIGRVAHIRILASKMYVPHSKAKRKSPERSLLALNMLPSPPVAIRDPSGWTLTENIEARFLSPLSWWATHAGLVNRILETPNSPQGELSRYFVTQAAQATLETRRDRHQVRLSAQHTNTKFRTELNRSADTNVNHGPRPAHR